MADQIDASVEAHREEMRRLHAEEEAKELRVLRDVFAGVALLGLSQGGVAPGSERDLAQTAYSVADAMMAARTKQ